MQQNIRLYLHFLPKRKPSKPNLKVWQILNFKMLRHCIKAAVVISLFLKFQRMSSHSTDGRLAKKWLGSTKAPFEKSTLFWRAGNNLFGVEVYSITLLTLSKFWLRLLKQQKCSVLLSQEQKLQVRVRYHFSSKEWYESG